MNLRKLIKEELDDFKWMEEADHLSMGYINNKAMEFNPPIDDEVYLDSILDELKDIGFRVNFSSGNVSDNWDVGEDYIVGLYAEDGNIVWTSDIFETYQEHIDDYADKPVEVINGRELFTHLSSINESEFDWTKDAKPIQIGGMVIRVRSSNDGEIPVDYVDFGDKVKTRPTSAHPEGFVFTVEDMKEYDKGRIGLWGSDIPEDVKWRKGNHAGEKNHQFTHALIKV